MGCGKEIVYVDKDGKPVVPGDCLPKPAAVNGEVFYIAHGIDAPIANEVQIGQKSEPGLSCTWLPTEGLSDANACQPIASPEASTNYELTVTNNKCGTSAKGATLVIPLKETRRADPFIRIGDEVYFTGYNEGYRFLDHYRASYLHMGTGYYGAFKFAQDTIDLTPPGFHTNRQPRGSCWAEGARSCGEATYHYVTKKHEHVSTQRIIDCSGFGSAGSGGQISVDDLVTHGLVKESDYPYNGNDNRCKKEVQSFYKAKSTFILRDSSGGRPKLDDIRQAHFAFGASEDCGNAGALGSGGNVKNPGGGGTNHCWGGFGICKFPDGSFGRLIQNSWGADWGDNGQGCYGFKSDGSISTGIMAENKFVDMGSPCPPPKADAGPDKTILQIPGLPQEVKIGTAFTVGYKYKWSIISGDANLGMISDLTVSSPIVSPKRTTVFQVDVQNECATAHAQVTVHAWRKDASGRRVEAK